jgi:hypothetical protein
MPITTIRPTGTISIHADYALVGGANAHSILSDNSDASYLSLSVDDGTIKYVKLSMADITLTPGDFIKQVRHRLRYVNLNAGSQTYIDVTLTDSAEVNQWANVVYNDIDVAGEFTGAWRTVWPISTSSPWSEAEVDDLCVQLRCVVNKPNLNRDIRLYELYVDVETNSLPVCVVNAPSGAATTTTKPSVTMTYTDADSDIMDRYEIKIFDAATYGAGGFSPDTSTPTWTSGQVSLAKVTGDAFSVVVGTDLINGTSYRAYARLRQAVWSAWSAWAFSSFNVALDAPAQPTLVGTVENNLGRIKLDFNGRDNLLTKNQASFETSASWAIGPSTTISRVTTQFLNGVASMQVTRSGSTGIASVQENVGGTSGTPILPGVQYTALASIKAGTTVRSCSVSIVWFNAAGGTISTSTGTAGNNSAAGWTQFTCTATSPALAVFAAVQINVAAVVVAENHFIDAVSFAPGSSTVWTRGGFVSTGNYRTSIERSIDAGATWSIIIGGSFIPSFTTEAATLYDYTVPLNTSVIYRVRTYGIDVVTGLEIAGLYSTTVGPLTSVPTTSTGWYIKDPLDPTKNQVIDLDQDAWEFKIKEEQAVYKLLGRSDPIVVSDVVRTIEGIIKPAFTSKAAYDAFIALRNNQHTLLLQRVYMNEEWYIRLGAELSVHEEPGDYRVATVDFVQVASVTS